jgi:hypothetical protein
MRDWANQMQPPTITAMMRLIARSFVTMFVRLRRFMRSPGNRPATNNPTKPYVKPRTSKPTDLMTASVP